MRRPFSQPNFYRSKTSKGGLKSDEARLQAERAQLIAYAKDVKQMVEQEQLKSRQIKKAHAQMLAYAQDLKTTLESEQRKNRELEQAYIDTILRLTRASRYKDEETGAHITRLSRYSRIVALHIGWEVSLAECLFIVAPMHDVGKNRGVGCDSFQARSVNRRRVGCGETTSNGGCQPS